jgi:hypothetical protein
MDFGDGWAGMWPNETCVWRKSNDPERVVNRRKLAFYQHFRRPARASEADGQRPAFERFPDGQTVE